MSATFKAMIKDGSIKRADAMKARIGDIHAEPGFNERIEGPELEASIAELAAYILAGGAVPPLEVRPRNDGGVWIVDGHRRHRAYLRAVEAGAPIEWVEVRQFAGNDVDRVARIVSSNTNLPLSPLEKSRVYKRLYAFGLGSAEIAAKVGRSRTHVEQLLTLAHTNADVQQMVQSGAVSASLAITTAKAHGEAVGDVLAAGIEDAAASGRTRVKPAQVVKRNTFDLFASEALAALAEMSDEKVLRVTAGDLRQFVERR